ncbi:hypothetical protein OHC33_001965 [Knufia fluminis]|uniref:Holocytochrome c-type synthase n=1 Tax=Knufia fluminis TaxID=191047 RepID=A0AAN8IB48_9EURO|nr:hypothetical protein OHC33_001965 [Knufia fluminis]
MGWWKADPVEKASEPPPSTLLPHPQIPSNHPPVADSVQQDACPVDHKTREIWLQAAKRQQQQSAAQQPSTDSRNTTLQQHPEQQNKQQPPTTRSSPLQTSIPVRSHGTPDAPLSFGSRASRECSSTTISQSPTLEPITVPTGKTSRTLSQDREVSTIPRAMGLATAGTPANNEVETGRDSSGNWIYPSETQFFNAVMKKAATNTSPQELAGSISSIIPIHNAVNERAWHLIKQWEGDSSKQCGGPKLLSFQGLGAGALSPKAKWKTTVMGAIEPFDRHDWTVERCDGGQVEYIIDFYQGKEREDVDPRRRAQELNFYLDVRPKLNSFEGVRMRAEKFLGWR